MLKPTSNLVENSPTKPPFIGQRKLALWSSQQLWTAVGRPPTVKNLTVGPAVDRPGRLRPGTESRHSLSVDRPGRPWPGTENRDLCRSTDPVDWSFPESRRSLRSTGTVDRPSSQNWRACLCTSVDRLGRPTSSSVDRLLARSTDF